MGKHPEYISPFTNQSENPGDRVRAGEALKKLLEHFHPNMLSESAGDNIGATRRMSETLSVYVQLLVRAAVEEIPQEKREAFIKEGLIANLFIDPSDPTRADEEYRIISEGYELNRIYFDEKLGRRRRFRNSLLDMERELRNPSLS